MPDYNCYDPAANPTADIVPQNYAIYICKWNGRYPSSFSGVWYSTSPIGTVGCELYPRTPTAVIFTRPNPCAVNYLPGSSSPAVPFNLIVTDPRITNTATPHEQALSIAVSGIVPALPTGTPDSETTCGLNTIFLGYTFGGDCSYRLEITGVTM